MLFQNTRHTSQAFKLQITINALKNLVSAIMAPPVSKLGRPQDVTVQIVTKETDVTIVLMVTMDTAVVCDYDFQDKLYFSWISIFLKITFD